MQRRQFLTAAATTAAALALPKVTTAQTPTPASTGRQLIDLRTYRFASAAKRDAYAKFLADVGVPAFTMLGIETAGLFKVTKTDNPKLNLTDDPAELMLILFHDNFESFVTFEPRLAAHTRYQEAGRTFLAAPKAEPAFARYDSHLLLSFAAHPKIVRPTGRTDDSLFELRTYESHSEDRAANKVTMFNEGEIPIFAQSGMPGVFFGAAIAGNDLPHLTYMIHHGSEPAQKHWDTFRPHPDWKKMQAQPQYKDNTSKIQNWFLRPLPGSQI